tara:strand:+ start:2328 stop:2516 length:189 start_codon:yes stop_codon:yes gene_type:complete
MPPIKTTKLPPMCISNEVWAQIVNVDNYKICGFKDEAQVKQMLSERRRKRLKWKNIGHVYPW